ncbi:uncharacterized protein LOC107263673 isoform X2 [Cephus cinctus]|uniref:Uncharacterized protein LOC107263673 isoform X2 n=1 Tax=Cephus cinctus TaxID=211228 RepID=A0AAJ7BIP5_CEPCN|nr:uncharacterized protein LOC107263673 isoform X2 [Cephus cinctus]
MQYLVLLAIILTWMADRLKCSTMNGILNPWSGGPLIKLEIWPEIMNFSEHKVIFRRKNESLNMTCTAVYQNNDKKDPPLFEYTVDWIIPAHIQNGNRLYSEARVERGQAPNTAWLWFSDLTEKDAGDYKCMAVAFNSTIQKSLSTSIRLSVKPKYKQCGPLWFRCHNTICIMNRFVCDGKKDCDDGEDESQAAGCGKDPCAGKMFCYGRCMPPEWCCDQHNCTATSQLAHPEPSPDHPRFTDIGFLQITIYTVIGCAMAFMFIVTILVIAICRVQMKRAMNSRCSQQMRIGCSRTRHTVPLYDLDVYLNRTTAANRPGGRPVEPPPYSEVVAVPPREGPPPPYVSCENLLEPPAIQRTSSFPNSNAYTAENSQAITNERNVSNENTDSSTTRVSSSIQSGANFPNIQCFTSGQIPRPQVQPGFGIFNFNLNCDNISNATFNISDNVTLNASGNSDSSSTGSAGSFTIARNITSHSQNFEPEYMETDSLLTDSHHNVDAQHPVQVSRNGDSRYVFLDNRRTGRCANSSTDDTPRHWREVERSLSGSEDRTRAYRSRNSENEGIFLETEHVFDPIDSISNDTSNAAAPLPYFLNSDSTISGFKDLDINPSSSTMTVDETGSTGLVSNKRDLAKGHVEKYGIISKVSADVINSKLNDNIADVSLLVQTQKCLDKNAHDDNVDNIPKCENLDTHKDSLPKDERETLLPSLNSSSNDIHDGNRDATDGEQATPIREVQPLVLPLRESFIGVRKEI